MSLKIHKALSYHDDRLPPEGRAILANSNNCGYTAIYTMQHEFNAFLVDDASALAPDLPFQKERETFDEWARRVEYYCAMQACLEDNVLDLNDFLTQNKYINKLRNREQIEEIVKRERASPNRTD